jgi:hypothetical protein
LMWSGDGSQKSRHGRYRHTYFSILISTTPCGGTSAV